MQILEYALVSFLSYSGVILGYFFLYLAPEEKKPGQKYFIFLDCLLFLAVAALYLFFSFRSILLILISAVAIALYFYLREHREYIAYAYFALVIYSMSGHAMFAIFPVAIFAYGLVEGALIFDFKNKNIARLAYLGFFVALSCLLYVFKLIPLA